MGKSSLTTPLWVCVCVCVCFCPFQALNGPTDFHETWYERCAIGGHRIVVTT